MTFVVRGFVQFFLGFTREALGSIFCYPGITLSCFRGGGLVAGGKGEIFFYFPDSFCCTQAGAIKQQHFFGGLFCCNEIILYHFSSFFK